MTRALIYARCSTTEQDYSRQIEELRRIAASKGWTITGEFGSYVSGGANDSDLNEIRSLASRRKIDALMVWELSRLSRKGPLAILGLLAQLEKEGVMVYSYSETWLNVEGPARELLIAIFGWVTKWERDMISARTRSAMASRKALGLHMGRPKGSKDRRQRARRTKRGTPRVLEERSVA